MMMHVMFTRICKKCGLPEEPLEENIEICVKYLERMAKFNCGLESCPQDFFGSDCGLDGFLEAYELPKSRKDLRTFFFQQDFCPIYESYTKKQGMDVQLIHVPHLISSLGL